MANEGASLITVTGIVPIGKDLFFFSNLDLNIISTLSYQTREGQLNTPAGVELSLTSLYC